MSSVSLPRPEGIGRSGFVLGLVGFAGLLGLIGVVLPLEALALVLGAAFVVVILRSLAAGVALFTALTFFEQLPGLSDFPLIKGAGAVLVLSWALVVLDRRVRTPVLLREQLSLAVTLVFLVVLALASSLWATGSGEAISSGIRLAQGILLVFIVYSAVRELRHLLWIVGAFVGAAAITAVVGLAGGASSEELGPYAQTQRLAGGIGDANEFASLLVPSLVFAAFALAVVRLPLLRLGLSVALGLVGIALLLTESRGGLVALGVSAVAVIVFAGPLRLRALTALSFVAALGFFYYTLVAPPESLSRITHFSAGGGTGRSDLWSIAIEMWRDRPILGIGAGNFELVEPRYAVDAANLVRVDLVLDTPKVAHNTYLHVLTELGLVGVTAFLIAILLALRSGVRAARAFGSLQMRAHELMTRGLVIGAIGMLTAFTFISAQYEKQLWLMLGLLAATSSLAQRARTPAVAGQSREYDRAVSEGFGEQLERSLAERLDTLATEQGRLERMRAAVVGQERELRDRVRRLEEREHEAAKADDLRVELAGRAESLRRLEETLREREAATGPATVLADATAATERLTEQLDRLERRERALEERAAQLDARALVIKELEAGNELDAVGPLRRELEQARTAIEETMARNVALETRVRGLEDQLTAAATFAENAALHLEGLEVANRTLEAALENTSSAEESVLTEQARVLQDSVRRAGELGSRVSELEQRLAAASAAEEEARQEQLGSAAEVARLQAELDLRVRALGGELSSAADAAEGAVRRVEALEAANRTLEAALESASAADDSSRSEQARLLQESLERSRELEERLAATAAREQEAREEQRRSAEEAARLQAELASASVSDDSLRSEQARLLEEAVGRSRELEERLAATAVREQEAREEQRRSTAEAQARSGELEARVGELEERLAAAVAAEAAAREEQRRAEEEAEQVRAQALAAAQRAATPEPAAATAPSLPVAPPSEGGANLLELESLVESAALDPERADELRAYLLYLRDFAGSDGSLPSSFDSLVDEVFGDLIRR